MHAVSTDDGIDLQNIPDGVTVPPSFFDEGASFGSFGDGQAAGSDSGDAGGGATMITTHDADVPAGNDGPADGGPFDPGPTLTFIGPPPPDDVSSPVANLGDGGGGSGGGSGPVTTDTIASAGSGIVFNNTFGPGVAGTAYQTDIIDAEQLIQSQWTGSVTINEEFLSSAPGQNGELASNSFYIVDVSYASFKAALASHDAGNPYATAAVAALPSTNPLTGNPMLALPLPYARMLGLSSATQSPEDIVTLNTSYNWSYGQDVIDTITHEISEGAMGRIGGLGDQNSFWSTMDLFRYSSAGVRDLTDGRDGTTTYFSYDGTHLSSAAGLSFNNEYTTAGFNNGGDTADFTQLDVFGTGSPGETFGLSATDIQIMDTLGWTPISSSPPPPPPPAPALTAAVESLSTTTVAPGGSLGFTLYDLNLGAGASSTSTTAIYLSTDATITTADTLLTTQSVGALTPYPAAGYYDSHSLTVALPGGLTPGTYYIGAIADYNDPNHALNAPSPTYDVMQITVTGAGAPVGTAVSHNTATDGLVLASGAGASVNNGVFAPNGGPDTPFSSPPPPPPTFPNQGLPDTVVGFSDGVVDVVQGGNSAGMTHVLGSSRIVNGNTVVSFVDQPLIVLPNNVVHGMFA